MNKTDLVSATVLGELKAIIMALNPIAKMIDDASFGKINPLQILNTKLFNYEKASSSTGWIQELQNREHGINHQPETQEYGISSFVFRDKRPFHPERFWDYLGNE